MIIYFAVRGYKMDCTKEYEKLATQFSIEGEILSVLPFGKGHINKTFLVTTDKKRYVMQIMNSTVFKNIEGLMNNVCAVTKYLSSIGVETLEIVPTKDGKNYLAGEKSIRMNKLIENTVTYQTVTDDKVFENTGKAFGEFQNHLANFDASVLVEIIPNFHNTPVRYQDFKKVLASDTEGRAKNCLKEIEFITSHADKLSKIVDGLDDGSIPLRVTHNDTKLNNILLDADTKQARAIIDLDTVMPGSMLYDFGDSIRFGASTAEEDEQDLEKVHFDVNLFEAYAKGFCGAVKNSITQKEIELLPYSAYLIALELGMRFLGDYLSGDKYFSIRYQEHNLVRARTQLKLADEMEQRLDEMLEICKKYC